MSGAVLKAVVAMASNRVIGRDGRLPWHLPEDLKRFKQLTLGHTVIMGRKTMESIGRALPKRRNIVVSRTLEPGDAYPGCEIVSSCEAALGLLRDGETGFVIGGAELYAALLPECSELYLSYVFAAHEGDVSLPRFEDDFTLIEVLYADDNFELRRFARNR